jgi:hypothetical protein
MMRYCAIAVRLCLLLLEKVRKVLPCTKKLTKVPPGVCGACRSTSCVLQLAQF